MKLIIAGSREFSDYQYLTGYVSTMPPWIAEPTEIVSGCAAGADTLGEKYAQKHGLRVKLFPANWARHQRAAGPIRNEEMAVYADGLIAFWDGKSRGTAHMIQSMKNKKKLAYVVRTDIEWCKQMNKGFPVLNNVEIYNA